MESRRKGPNPGKQRRHIIDTTKLAKIDGEIAKAEQAKKDAAKKVRSLRKERISVLESLVPSTPQGE